MNGIKKFFTLSSREKQTLIEATIFCICIKLIVIFLPLKRYTRILGEPNAVYGMEPSEKELHLIFSVSRAIIQSRKLIPWKSQCLTEAIVAKIMLQRRRILSTLYLGVNKNSETMIAHAWLRCGTSYVIGKKGSNQFVVVSTFA